MEVGFPPGLPHLRDALPRAEAGISLLTGDQLIGDPAVDIQALRLLVRTMGAAAVGAFVPVEPEPAEGLVKGTLGFRVVALLVRVFQPEDELAPVMAGKQPVVERRADIAHVGLARGAGRVSHPNRA